MATIDSELVGTELTSFFSDPAPSETEQIAAINAAIDASWPEFKLFAQEAAEFTLVSQTYEYTLSSLSNAPVDGYGIDTLLVDDYSLGKVRVLDYEQIYNGTNWVIRVGDQVLNEYQGRDVDVQYSYRVPRITSLSTADVSLPYDYVLAYAKWWWAVKQSTQSHRQMTGAYNTQIAIWEEQWRDSKRRNMILPPPAPVKRRRSRTTRTRARRRVLNQ